MAFDLDGARKAGYSDDEIADFLSKEAGFDVPAAREAGYSSKAIVGFLADTLKTKERAKVNAELDEPYRPVSRAVAPKQNAGAGRGMMAEQAGERAAYNAPKKPVATGVMAGYVDPGTPTPGVTESYAPTTPETRAAINNLYNAATPEKRAEIAAGQGFVAQQVTELEQRNALMDARKSPTLEKIDPRAEKRASRMVGDGLDPEIANRMAPTQARMGVTPGQEIPGTIGDTKVDFSTRDAFSKAPVLSNPVVRGIAKGGLEMVSGYAGVGEAMADLAFGEQKGGRQSSEWIRAKQEAIGEGTGGTARLESVISSLTQQLPYMVGGAWVARGAASAAYRSAITAGADEAAAMAAAKAAAGNQGSIASLSGMAVTSFGSEYLNGKNKGLTPGESAARASLFAAFEVIGESFGLGNALRSIERAAGGISGIGALSEFLAANLYRTATREVPGELLTTTGQFLSDKLPGIGLNQQAGWDEYIKQMGETVIQTVMQGGMMAGGTTGVARAVAYLREGGRTPETPDPYAPQSLFSTPPKAATQPPITPNPPPSSPNPPTPQVIQSPEAAAAGLAPIVIPGSPDQNGAVGALTSSAPMLAAIDKATTEVGPVQPGDTSTEREQIPAANVQVAPPQAPAGDPPAPTVTALPDSFPSKSAASIFIKQNGLQDTVAEKGDAGWMVRPAMRAETPEEAAKNDARVQSLNTTFERIGSTERVRAVRGDASEKSTVARVLGEVFGLPQVLVRGIKDNALYLDGVSYINAKISKTGQVIQAAVHEAFHWAAATHPDIAQGYLDAITPFRRAGVLAERAKFENENLKPGERQFPLSAGRGEDFSKVNSAEEEVGADIWGALGMDPVLWQQMRAKDPGLFRAIRYRFLENVTRAINALSKRGVNVGKLVTDLDRVRELTSDAMAAVARRGDAKQSSLETFPVTTDIGKPISATAIPNSAPAAPPSATPKVKPKKRAKDAFLAFLGDHGVSMAHQKTITGETGKKGNRMIQFAGPMFRHTGLALDELALLAVEAGFLTQADIDSDLDNGGVNKLIEMIRRAHAGEAIDTVSGQEDSFEALAQAHYEAMADAEAAIVEETSDDEINALLQLAGEEDASNEEIDYIPDQGNLAGQTEGAAPGAAVNRDSGGSQAARAAAGDEEGFDLTAPTPEGLKRTSEQGQARQQEQARRDAAPPPEEFVLTGSNRPADRAAAAGQMELGAAPADVVEQTPEGPVLMLQGDEAGLADALANVVENDDERLAALFNPPGKPAKPIVGATLPMDEAQARVDAWRAEAQRQGATGENAGRTVLSLFDTSGGWSQPWVDAGYSVIRFDIQDGRDINDFSAESLLEEFGNDDIWAVLAAPPCTDFASSGAQWWKAKDADGRTEASNELVRQTLRTVELFRPAVWSMENPVGRIARLNDLPDARLTFQPNLYGDPYTKKTLLWGNFNTDLPQAPVEDTEGSKMHKMSSGNKYGRSLTPEGFAYAFFVANNAAGMPPVERLAQEFHGIKANEFAPALERMSEADVRSLIQDRYYDGNLDAVRNLLASGQPRRSKKGEERVAQSKKVADPAFQARISRIARLTPEQQASTILAFMTGKAGRDAFIEQDIGQIPDVVQWLSERRAESGLPTLDISVDADREQLATMMAAEALAAIESAGNAVEWYDATIRKMLESMAVKYPELKSDPHARTAFLIAIAITSQTMNVEANLKFAASQYENRDANGMFPIRGSGKSLGAMEENFRLANTLLRVLGPDLLARFLVTEFTASELGAMGLPIDELGSESVLGSAVFGPKIGFGFFSNLTGNFEPTTMDMWFMRTVGRLAGTLASFEPGKFAGQVRRLRDALKERGSDGIYAPIFPASARQAARASDEGAVALARLVMSAHNRDYARNRAQFDSGARIKTNLVGASATIIKSMDKPKDAPQNGTERRLLRDVVKRMVTKVQSGHGKRIPPAALQALIWYPEQEFWKSLGVKLTVTSQDYAGAAVKFLEDAGYAPQTIAAAGRGSGSGGARQVAAGAGAGGNGQAGPVSLRADALEGRDRADFIRARLTGNPGLVDKVRRTLDEQHPEEVGPRRSKRGKDQLSFDYELDPSQAGPAGEAAKRRAVDAVDSLRGTAGILALALSRDLAARQRTTLVGQTVAAPVDLAVLAQVYRDPRFETFRIFFVDGQDRVVSQIGLTQRLPGAVNAVMGDDAYEFANNLMVEARKKGATGFYMLHNHPSGQATPSGADESMTVSYAQQLMPTMKFHGHVVIDTNEFSVIDRNGRSQKHIRDFKQKAPLDRGDWEYWQIKGPNDAMNIAKAIEKDPNAVTLIMTNYQLQVHAVTTIPRASISSNKQATFKAVARATLRNTGSHVFAVSHDMDALLQVRGLVQDGIHISPNGMVSSLRETRPYGGNTPHHKASLREPRLSPDTSEEFNYLRPVIKSAAPTSRNVPKGATGTLFEPPRRSKVDDLGFFSQLERAVEGAPIKAAPAEQWKAWLAGNAAKMGVKAEEIQWSGVTDWLALQTGKVTKDAVVQYLAGNGVQVTETVRGVGSNEASWQLADKMEELGYRVEDDGGDDVFYFDPQGNSIGYEELPPELQRAVDQWGRDASPPTKYQSYTLPGGQNYRELLLTLDQKREKKPLETISIDEALARVRNGLPVAFEDDMSTATIDRTISLTDPNSYYLEQVNGGFGRLLAARVDIDGSLIGPDDGPSASRFESGHWNEPNVLAHIRYNERTDADGKRVLFIEEIQSDWAQAGRKSGFRSARPDTTGWTAEKQYDGTNGYSVWRVFKADGSTASNGVNAESAGQAIEAIADRWAGSGVPNAPFVRDTNAWVALAVKRMIIEAARRDFDKIAFTTGEQNAERYDLSKHIDTISYAKADGGTVSVDAIKDGSNVFSKANMTMTEVEDTVGKEVAKKIADGGGEVNPRTGYTDLSGLDLKVGGDGMKAFYNQIVPGVVRDVLKKVGGGSMKVVTLPAIPGSKGNGWGSTDENMIGDPERSQPGFDITPAMREKVAGGLPRFSKTGSKAPLERDELGRFRFAYGRRLEDTVKALLDPILTRLALKMASPELRKKLRAMKAEIARAQETAVEVAESMKAMPTDQAEMISDIIEQELVAGTVPPTELVTIATRIGAAMEAQTNELVRLGMISQEAADRWRGRYLPRFYESKLSKRVDPWMQAVMMAIRRPKSMQGIKGNNLKARGLPLETIDVADLPSWLADGWEIRDENYRAGTSDRVTVWRDYTREEREEMGEIRDARFRFVMGYMAAQKDIALGRLFEKIAADTADTGPHPGWVKVPSTKVEETGVNRFGKLSGMWVPKEVFDHLAKYDDTGANHELLLMYRKALGLWKESKTVLNPTAHANNVFGNVTMAHFAGVSYWDVHKYAGTVRDLVKDAPMVREARDAGLFLSTMGKDEIVQALPESLRLLADMQESSLEKGGRRVWNALALWLRKPMGAAYAGEDLFFRYMIYREARGRGLEPGDAVNYAADFVFEYDDLPKGAMAIRDTFLPFFSWTYKAIPAMFTTVTNYPWRFAAPAVAMYAVNAAMYAVAFGEKDDDWWQKIGRYVTDSDFRDKVRAEEKSERANLPPWLKGNSFTLGLPKAIRLGMDELTQLPVFMDISRMFPAGDLLDANSNAGGVPWLQSLTPSNPVFTTLSAIFVNRDLWTGRDLVDKNDTSAEAATKRAEWVWKQFTPAIAFGNYQLDRVLDTVARAAGTEIPGMFRDHTGVGRDKLPVQPLYTIENTFGIKARPYDLEQSRQIGESQKRELIRSLEYEIKRTQRYVNAGVMSFSQASKQIETDRAKIQNLKQGLTLEGAEKD